MTYKCNFPGCNYITEVRSQIHNHHIVSKADKGKNGKHNLVMLCPTCHTKIFQESAKYGIHSKSGKDSIILIGKIDSTAGKLLEYIDHDGNTQYHILR